MAIRRTQVVKIVRAIKERNAERDRGPNYFNPEKIRRLNATVEAACRNATAEEYKAAIVEARRT